MILATHTPNIVFLLITFAQEHRDAQYTQSKWEYLYLQWNYIAYSKMQAAFVSLLPHVPLLCPVPCKRNRIHNALLAYFQCSQQYCRSGEEKMEDFVDLFYEYFIFVMKKITICAVFMTY